MRPVRPNPLIAILVGIAKNLSLLRDAINLNAFVVPTSEEFSLALLREIIPAFTAA
jgi:hypothetical protein